MLYCTKRFDLQPVQNLPTYLCRVLFVLLFLFLPFRRTFHAFLMALAAKVSRLVVTNACCFS